MSLTTTETLGFADGVSAFMTSNQAELAAAGLGGVGAALGETPVGRHVACHGFDRWSSSE